MDAITFLKEQILAAIPDKVRNVSELAEKAGVNQPNLSQFMVGKRKSLNFETAYKILQTLGISFSGSSSEITREVCLVDTRIVPAGDGLPPPNVEDYIAAPLVGEVGAGAGMIDQEEVLSWVLVHSDSLAVRNRTNLIAVEVGKNQRSMVPTLHPQDIVLVNRDDYGDTMGYKPPGNIFLVREPGQEGGAMVKRVSITKLKDFSTITFYSDNPEYEPETFPMSEYEDNLKNAIIGRVVWAWTDLSRK